MGLKCQDVRAMIEAAQIRAARALLDLSQANLSDMASVSATTIKRLEGATEIRGAAETLWKIQKALEAAGIEFIPAEEGKGPGVRLKAAPRQAQKPRFKRER
jgi:transcriptional regulator with XRE-family HTH domain